MVRSGNCSGGATHSRERGTRGRLLAGVLVAVAAVALAGLLVARRTRRPSKQAAFDLGIEERDLVDEASEESFPASDPPSWTPSHAGGPVR